VSTQPDAQKAEPLRYCPPVLFWIAEYMDGSCLCQFDPESGVEAKFKSVDQSRLRSFGWYPVSRKLATLVKTVQLRVNPLLHIYKLELGPGKGLIAHRQEKIHHVSIHVCLKCGYLWQFRDKPGDLNYPYSALKVEWTVKTQDKKDRRLASAKCPQCSAYTEQVCPKCLIERTKYREDGKFVYRCNQCDTPLPDQTRRIEFEERHTDYFLGYVHYGERFILKIKENGNVETS
jgi:hypothetical protein